MKQAESQSAEESKVQYADSQTDTHIKPHHPKPLRVDVSELKLNMNFSHTPDVPYELKLRDKIAL